MVLMDFVKSYASQSRTKGHRSGEDRVCQENVGISIQLMICRAIENWKNDIQNRWILAPPILGQSQICASWGGVQQGLVLLATLVTCAICICSFHPVLLVVIVFHPVGWPHLVYPAKHARPKMKLPPHLYPAARSDIGIQDICFFFSNYHFPYKFCPKNRGFHGYSIRFPVSPSVLGTPFKRRLLAGALLQMTHVSHRILDGGQCLADKLAADVRWWWSWRQYFGWSSIFIYVCMYIL